MAQALAIANGLSGSGTGVALYLTILYTGDDLGGNPQSGDTYVDIDASADTDTTHAAMTAAIIRDADNRGYTVAAEDITLPAYTKG